MGHNLRAPVCEINPRAPVCEIAKGPDAELLDVARNSPNYPILSPSRPISRYPIGDVATVKLPNKLVKILGTDRRNASGRR
jgi:hypothetical protein